MKILRFWLLARATNTHQCVGGASTLWQKNPLIMLLEAPSHSISPDAVRVGDNGVIYRQWTFSFFFFSSPSKLHVVLFVVDISTRPILLIFNFYSWFFVKVLFVFNFVNQFQFDIYYFFSICSLFFWFFIFLFGPFVKVLLVFNFTL